MTLRLLVCLFVCFFKHVDGRGEVDTDSVWDIGGLICLQNPTKWIHTHHTKERDMEATIMLEVVKATVRSRIR